LLRVGSRQLGLEECTIALKLLWLYMPVPIKHMEKQRVEMMPDVAGTVGASEMPVLGESFPLRRSTAGRLRSAEMWDALTLAALAWGVMLGKLVVHNLLNRTYHGLSTMVIFNSPQHRGTRTADRSLRVVRQDVWKNRSFTTGEHVPWQVELIPSSAASSTPGGATRNTNVQAPTEEPLCAVQRRAKLPGGPPLGNIPTRPTPPDVAKGGYSALTGNK